MYVTQSNFHCIVLRTFSKAFGLAGLRCGYAIYRGNILENIKKIIKALPYRMNRLSCCAAKVCMENESFFLNQIKEIRALKSNIYAALDKMNLSYVISETNFVFIEIGEDVYKLCDSLKDEYGISVRCCAEFGFEHYIRVSMGTKEEMDRFIFALEKLMRKYMYGRN